MSLVEVPCQRFFTIGQAAHYLGLSRGTVRKLSDLGIILAKRVNGYRMFTLESLNNFIDTSPDWIYPSHNVKQERGHHDIQNERRKD